MKAQGVPFGGLPWEAPTTPLGRFLPDLRDDLHRRSTPLVFGEGRTNSAATRFPRGIYPPRLARPRPYLGRASRPKTTTGDQKCFLTAATGCPLRSSSSVLRRSSHRSRKASVNNASIPASRREYYLKKCPRMLHARHLFVRGLPERPAFPRGGPGGASPALV